MGQILPVAVEVLKDVHGTPFEVPAKITTYDERPDSWVGCAGLTEQVQSLAALLLGEVGFESQAVDVENHELLPLDRPCLSREEPAWRCVAHSPPRKHRNCDGSVAWQRR